MISIEYNDEKILKHKESYLLLDSVQVIGGSNIAYTNTGGRTQIDDKRVRDDGFVKRYAMTLFLSYNEREIARRIVMGTDKTSVCTPATLIIDGEGDRDTVCKVVASQDSFYEEKNLVENIDVIKSNPSELGYDNEDILYEIDLIFVVLNPVL